MGHNLTPVGLATIANFIQQRIKIYTLESLAVRWELRSQFCLQSNCSFQAAGKLNELVTKDYVLIQDSLRDEGTSYHYLPAEDDASLNPDLSERLRPLFGNEKLSVQSGRSWTTDAPYRETNSAIQDAKIKRADCVEMEASALYAFSKAKKKRVVCFAHLTNAMAQQNGDFEKGSENGSLTSLELIFQTAKLLMPNEN